MLAKNGCSPYVEGTNISFMCWSGRDAGQSDVLDVRGCRIAPSALICVSTRETSPDWVPGPPMAKRPDVQDGGNSKRLLGCLHSHLQPLHFYWRPQPPMRKVVDRTAAASVPRP